MICDDELSRKRAELDAIHKEIEADLRRRVILDPLKRQLRTERRLTLERELAAAAGDEYAEELAIDVIIGDECYLITGFGEDVALLCGDVGREGSVLFEFKHNEELRFGGLNDEVFESHPLYGKGMDIYGLFIVRNSRWKRELQAGNAVHTCYSEEWWSGFEHYILRGKEGELSCLARSYGWRVLRESILELREKVAFWKNLSQ
jgi:hypothetical protein